jgi:hypothetical protein
MVKKRGDVFRRRYRRYYSEYDGRKSPKCGCNCNFALAAVISGGQLSDNLRTRSSQLFAQAAESEPEAHISTHTQQPNFPKTSCQASFTPLLVMVIMIVAILLDLELSI